MVMAPAPFAPPRRSGVGCFLVGCGGIALLAFGFVALLVIGGLASSSGGYDQGPVADDAALEAELAAFDAERVKYYELAAQLEGNPVAPLVTQSLAFARLEDRTENPYLTSEIAAKLTQEAQTAREELEQRIADAAIRRTNASGFVSEGLVDEAGAGFIDIAWDAGTACGTSRRADEGWFTAGCVGEDPLIVHMAPEEQLPGDLGMRVVVLHELAHLYHRADSDAHPDGPSAATQLLEQGYFQGSSEVMADCYALTYLNQWTLTFEGRDGGYGYVCGDQERALIREWAAGVHAPMP
jgi:hypothetical protein